MRRTDPADERIAEKERELARLQTEGALHQLDARLAREALSATVSFGSSIADMLRRIMSAAGDQVEASIGSVARDLGGEDRR